MSRKMILSRWLPMLAGVLAAGMAQAQPDELSGLVAATSMEILISAENELLAQEWTVWSREAAQLTPLPVQTPLPEPSPARWFWGDFRSGMGYTDNVDFTSSPWDLDLWRQPVWETRKDDIYFPYRLQLNADLPVACYLDQIGVRYRMEGRNYGAYHREDFMNNRLELLPRIQLNPGLALIPVLELEYDNRNPEAEYLRPEYFQHGYGLRLESMWDAVGKLSYSGIYRQREYNRFTDVLQNSPLDTPFYTWRDLEHELVYHRDFCQDYFMEVVTGWRDRNSTSPRYTARGEALPGTALDDDEGRLALAVGWYPHQDCYARFQLERIATFANDDYYGYDENACYLYLINGVNWSDWDLFRLTAYMRYYDRQWKAQLADEDNSGSFTGRRRHDYGYQLTLSAERELYRWMTLGTQYSRHHQKSNDISSSFEADSVEVYVTYSF